MRRLVLFLLLCGMAGAAIPESGGGQPEFIPETGMIVKRHLCRGYDLSLVICERVCQSGARDACYTRIPMARGGVAHRTPE